MPKAKNKPIRATMNVSVPPSLKKWVQEYAAEREEYDSQIVREALELLKNKVEEGEV